MRYHLASIVLSLVAVHASFAATDSSEPSGIESLGRELLDDLNPDLLPPNAPPNDGQRIQPPEFSNLGEDIGQPLGPLSLARVRQTMQQAKSLLGTSNTAPNAVTITQAGAAQQQVVDQLDKLIAELSKQCQGGQCQPSAQAPKPSERSQAKPGKPASAAGRGQTAARESSDRLDRSTAQPVEKADIEAIMKDLWGHLPAREREQMMQSFSEEFLPKYQLEIEQYYRRLSEENESGRR
jgi:hypothetical protein